MSMTLTVAFVLGSRANPSVGSKSCSSKDGFECQSGLTFHGASINLDVIFKEVKGPE